MKYNTLISTDICWLKQKINNYGIFNDKLSVFRSADLRVTKPHGFVESWGGGSLHIPLCKSTVLFWALLVLYLKQSFSSCCYTFFSLPISPSVLKCMLAISSLFLVQPNMPPYVLFLKLSLTIVNRRLLWGRGVLDRICKWICCVNVL